MENKSTNGNDRLAELQARLDRMRGLRTLSVGMAVLFIVIGASLLVFVFMFGEISAIGENQLTAASIIFMTMGPTLAITAASMFPVRLIEYQIQSMQDENELQNMSSASQEQKAYKLLRIQQGQLTQFLNVILTQSRWIFVVGLVAMGVGVFVIIFAIYQAKASGATDTEKWVVGILGAIGAILTNFVAAIYLKMFADIGGAVKDAVAMLAKSSNVNFANVLISKMDMGENKDRNAAFKELAISIVSKA